jgi:hypothetical protein
MSYASFVVDVSSVRTLQNCIFLEIENIRTVFERSLSVCQKQHRRAATTVEPRTMPTSEELPKLLMLLVLDRVRHSSSAFAGPGFV